MHPHTNRLRNTNLRIIMEQGVVLLIVGMGVVFCFLVLLVFAVQAMGNILQNIVPHEHEPAPSKPEASTAPDPALIVAVAAAQRFRTKS